MGGRSWNLALLLLFACADADGQAAQLHTDAALPAAALPDAGQPMRDPRSGPDASWAASRDASPDAASVGDASRDPGPVARSRDGGTSQGAHPRDASVGTQRDAQTNGPPGWKLVWSDEFEGPRGSLPSPERWVFETGGHGFGNNQLEYDTARSENAALDGQGQLVITARQEEYMGKRYTSARLKTQGKFERTYGRYEARMRLPRGQGIWPAFWMLGGDIARVSWPGCGEIDIMENIGREPSRVHGTLHGPGYSGGSGIGAPFDLADGAAFADAFHVFAIEWEDEVVRWYVDGALYQTRTPRDLPSGAAWVYDHPFFLLLNLAVGGQWPGSPDASTTFPQQLIVDYVRVYERAR